MIEIYQRIRPQNGRLARAQGLPKIHKEFINRPKFRPIVDTTGTVHYHVGKCLSEVFNPITNNEYTIKDSFHTVTRIKNCLIKVVDLYQLMLHPYSPTCHYKKQSTLYLKKIYAEKVININIKKNTMRIT